MEQWTGSKLGMEYAKVVYCQPAYLTYAQSTSCEMLGSLKHKLESRLPGCIEQSFRLCGRRRGWDVSREQHRNMYIIYDETEHQPRLDA